MMIIAVEEAGAAAALCIAAAQELRMAAVEDRFKIKQRRKEVKYDKKM